MHYFICLHFSYRVLRYILKYSVLVQWQKQHLNLFFLSFFGISWTTINLSKHYILCTVMVPGQCFVNLSIAHTQLWTLSWYSRPRSDRKSHLSGMPSGMAAPCEQALLAPKKRERMAGLLLPLRQILTWM